MKTQIQKRGTLTKRIKHASMKSLGYEISQEELRLMPYIQYVMVNEQYIDRCKINDEERDILNEWDKKDFINRNHLGYITVSNKFWTAICKIIYLGYVDIERTE